MQAIVNRIGGYYRSHHLMPEEKIQCMEYTIHSILNEISKFVIYGCLFFLLGRWKVYWIVYLCFVSIRLFAGGVHCKTYLQCLGVSFVFISAFVYLPRVFPWTIEALAEPAWLSLCMPLLFSPATPQFRQIKRRRTRWVLKLLAVVLGSGWILFGAYTTVSYDIRASVLWTVMVANYQLVVPALNAYFNKRRGNQHEENSENFGQNSGCAVDDDRQLRNDGSLR